MVCISYKLSRYREGYEARRMGLEAIPLCQHIQRRNGKRESRMAIRPDAVHDFFEMADHGQHRQHRFDEDAVLPLPTLAQFAGRGIALRRMGGDSTQDHHALFKLPNEPLQGVIRDLGGGTLPRHNQPPLVQHQSQSPPTIHRLPCAALAIGQGNGERDAELLTDAPGDVPVAGQVFSYQNVAGGEPSLGTISRLKFRQS